MKAEEKKQKKIIKNKQHLESVVYYNKNESDFKAGIDSILPSRAEIEIVEEILTVIHINSNEIVCLDEQSLKIAPHHGLVQEKLFIFLN